MLDFSKLNMAQRRAVTHGKGPAIVLAGPGSGKTFLIVSRIIYLIEYQKVRPEEILVITFTKAAALSMQQRFLNSTQGKYDKVRFGTFHSFFFQILKEYDSYHNSSVFENQEKNKYLMNSFNEIGLHWDDSLDYDSFLNNPFLYATENMTNEQISLVLQNLKVRIRRDRKLDFDDMSDLVFKLFQRVPGILEEVKKRYKYIMVDEYQDTNEKQEEILRMLTAPENEIMVVGDDDQSIYGFRGSKPEIMREFKSHYSEAQIYVLEKNYRSTKSIVSAATKVISENKNRFNKTMKAGDETGEAVRCVGFDNQRHEFIFIAQRVNEMKHKYNVSYSEMAIVARTKVQQERIILFLEKENIPCKKGKNEENLLKHFVAKELLECFEFVTGMRDRAPVVWNEMGGNETKRKMLKKQTPTVAIHFICNAMGYMNLLKDQALIIGEKKGLEQEEMLKQWNDIIINIKKHAKDYKVLEEWVIQLRSYLETTKLQGRKDGVNVLTMHGSKGLEFFYVCIPDANEGIIPGKRCRENKDIEEERRLFYVAMTRAKKVLDILYLIGTADYPRLPSRFLNPLLKNETSV